MSDSDGLSPDRASQDDDIQERDSFGKTVEDDEDDLGDDLFGDGDDDEDNNPPP